MGLRTAAAAFRQRASRNVPSELPAQAGAGTPPSTAGGQVAGTGLLSVRAKALARKICTSPASSNSKLRSRTFDRLKDFLGVPATSTHEPATLLSSTLQAPPSAPEDSGLLVSQADTNRTGHNATMLRKPGMTLQEISSRYEAEFPIVVFFKRKFVSPEDGNYQTTVENHFRGKGWTLGEEYCFRETAGDGGTRTETFIRHRELHRQVRDVAFKFAPSTDHEQCVARLKSDARAYCREHANPPARSIPRIEADATPEEVIQAVLKDKDGMVIGENHRQEEGKGFFIDNIDALKKEGVQTLFLEGILSDRHQQALDDYLAASPGSPMPEKLRDALASVDRKFAILGKRCSATAVVESAQKARMKVVAIDCTASHDIHRSGLETDEEAQTRLEVMNYLATKKIEARENPGKWVALVGAGHANNYRGTPGLAELTNSAAVFPVATDSTAPRPSVMMNVTNHTDGIPVADIVLTC